MENKEKKETNEKKDNVPTRHVKKDKLKKDTADSPPSKKAEKSKLD